MDASAEPQPQAYDSAERTSFVGWQCRIRQHAVRRSDGRPSSGMRPDVQLADGSSLGNITVVMVKHNATEDAAQFKQIYLSTRSPLERYEQIMAVFQANYFQYPEQFSDCLTAIFSSASTLARRLLENRHCSLSYEQFGQRYSYPAQVVRLDPQEPAAAATYWHNALFSTPRTADISTLAFVPQWSQVNAQAATETLRESPKSSSVVRSQRTSGS